MRYLLAVIFPPVAVLLCGKPFQAFINFILCILFWIPGMIHALITVANHKADQRTERLVKEIRNA